MPANKDQIITFVNERYRHSRSAFSRTHQEFLALYKTYRAWRSRPLPRHRNNVVLPFAFSSVNTDVAKKLSISFPANEDSIKAVPTGPEDSPRARKLQALLNEQLIDMDVRSKAGRLITMADVYGTGFSQLGWRFEERVIKRRVQATSQRERTILENRVMYDGPELTIWDPMDIFPQPGVACLKEADWVIVKYQLHIDDVKRDKIKVTEDNEEVGQWDPAGVAELELGSHLHDVNRLGEDEALRTGGIGSLKHTRVNSEIHRGVDDKAVSILEYWGKVPDEMAPDGAIWRVITVANGHIILRDEPLPYWHGEIPFQSYAPLPDPHFIFGVSKVSIISRFQHIASRFASQKLDVLEMFADPSFYVNRMSQVDTKNLFMAPGRLFFGEGPAGEAMQAIHPDLRGMQNLYSEIEQLDNWQQRGSGITEELGGSGTSRQTAREFLGKQENLGVRMAVESLLFEDQWLIPLVNQQLQLNQQFLESDREVRTVGGHIANPYTGELLPVERETIDLEDLYGELDIRPVGASESVPRAVKQQNWLALSQVLLNNPLSAQLLNHVAFFRETLRLYQIHNADEFLQVPPTQMDALNRLEQQQQGAPATGGANAPPSPLEATDASTLPPTGGLEDRNQGLGGSGLGGPVLGQ